MSHHQWTQEHLAWYINDTLVGEEHARVHQHLNECVLCRQEYAQLKCLSQHVSLEAARPLNSAAAFAELQPHLDQSSSAGTVSGFFSTFRQTPVTMRYVMAAQGAALILLASVLFLPDFDSNAVSGYTTLSSASSNHGDLRLVFDTQATQEQRELLLQSYGLELVGTVSSRGIATVKWSGKKRQEKLESLRAQSAIVLAEPVGDVAE